MASSNGTRTVVGVVPVAGFGAGQEPTSAESRLLKGRRFHSWQEFDNALDEYEASSGTVVRRIYRSKTVFTGRCRGWSKDHPDACKMELCARLMKKTGLITIRRVYLIHTCMQDIHKWRNGRNRARWVARKVMRIVKVNRDTTIEQLQQDLREYHMADSKQWSVQRARMACREKLGGGHKESFSQIPAYAATLRQADPGVHVVWNATNGEKFEKIFVAPSSSQHAFQFCRPVVGLDGTHTSGDYPMTALLATCHDGENNIVTLAWAIVPVENGDNWTWFLMELRTCYPAMPERGTIFISDRDKGLKTAVAEVFPGHHHSYCVQHIKANIKAITDLDCVAYFEKVWIWSTLAALTWLQFQNSSGPVTVLIFGLLLCMSVVSLLCFLCMSPSSVSEVLYSLYVALHLLLNLKLEKLNSGCFARWEGFTFHVLSTLFKCVVCNCRNI